MFIYFDMLSSKTLRDLLQ